MATITRAADACRRPYRFTVEQFERMIDLGVVPDSADVELVRGRLYRMTKHEPHNFTVLVIADALRKLFLDGFVIREEKSLSHDGRSTPEPDVAVVRGRLADFRPRPPSTSEAVLVVEVCHHTKRADYRDKLSLYAEARVPVYWIVDLDARIVAVHAEPTSRGEYARVETFAEGASAPVALDGREIGRIAVTDVLPPKSSKP